MTKDTSASTFSPTQPATIRPVTPDDVPALKALIDATWLFPADMLDDMLAPYFEQGSASSQFWLTDDEDGPVAVAYYAPERKTEGTWNLYLIAVHPGRQGNGRGSALLHHVELVLAARGERVLLVETSGLPEFQRTREFYLGNGYVEEARIRDFYRAGEDKIIFCKDLGTSSSVSAPGST